MDKDRNLAEKFKNVHDLNRTLYEIQASLKHLENQQSTITQLIEAKAEHHVEISYIKTGLDKQFKELNKINSRLDKIEIILDVKKIKGSKEKEKKGELVYGFIEVVKTYWHLIALGVSVISFVLSYYFGFKVD